MKTFHKIIARTCALAFRVGKGNVPRVSIMITLVAFIDLWVNILSSGLNTMNWFDWIFIAIFAFLIWVGFSWGGLGFFSLWPIRFEELDDYQKYLYSRTNFHDLTEDQADEIVKIIDEHEYWFA